MSNFSNSFTGYQNPIFQIMSNMSQIQNTGLQDINNSIINPNSMVQLPQNNPNNDQGNICISVNFRIGVKTITVQCQTNQKVSELIERYRIKSGDRDPSKQFKFNTRSLNENKTVAEEGIPNQGIIFVFSIKDMKGAF